VFGIIRPCRHRLGGELGAAWQAHLCGMCLSLRDDHGQAARLATNYDGLVISVLVEAQAEGEPQRRKSATMPTTATARSAGHGPAARRPRSRRAGRRRARGPARNWASTWAC
jgi:hypothetical protein